MKTKIAKILEFGMKMEKNAKDFYSFYANSLEDESLKALFNELIKIEEEHFKFLKSKYDKLDVPTPPQEISWVVDIQNKMVDPHILADNSELTKLPLSDIAILRLAYLIESDFASFYKNAAEKVDQQDVKEFLLELAKWEEEHENLFKNRYTEQIKKAWEDLDIF
ncbi:ferritin family protein [Caldicellulosiruptoraceae bacterium PP1]